MIKVLIFAGVLVIIFLCILSITCNCTKGKKFPIKINYEEGWACRKYRNIAGMKTQKDYPATEKLW